MPKKEQPDKTRLSDFLDPTNESEPFELPDLVSITPTDISNFMSFLASAEQPFNHVNLTGPEGIERFSVIKWDEHYYYFDLSGKFRVKRSVK